MSNTIFQRELYTVDRQSTITVNFPNKPNYFRIVNMGTGDLYFSAGSMPTVNRYDMKVQPAGAQMHVEAEGKHQAHIYNDGLEKVQFSIMYFEAPFEPLVLALNDAGGSGGGVVSGGGDGGSFDGYINGFRVSLPSGNNTIGKVDLNTNIQLGEILNSLRGAIPAGGNTIGKVDLNDNEQLQAIADRIAAAGIVYGKFAAGNVAAAGTTITPTANRKICRITFLSNDSESNMSVVIDGSTMDIKAGEVLDNFDIYTDSIQLLGGGAYRIAYNERVV